MKRDHYWGQPIAGWEKRRTVTEEIHFDSLSDDLDTLILQLTALKNEHKGKKLYLNLGTTGYDLVTTEIVYERQETDEEYEDRKKAVERNLKYAREEQEREKQRKKDLEQYKRLKQRLGL